MNEQRQQPVAGREAGPLPLRMGVAVAGADREATDSRSGFGTWKGSHLGLGPEELPTSLVSDASNRLAEGE